MTDDATLSDFASSGADEEADDSGTRSGASDVTSPSNPTSDDSESADPGTTEASSGDDASGDGTALSTYAWGEYTCTRCDRTTDRVWRDDGAFVCPDCKDW